MSETSSSPTKAKTPTARITRSRSSIDVETKLLSSFADKAQTVDTEVVFSFDTTGSMYACLEEVRKNLKEISAKLLKDVPKIRIGIIAMGDYCDQSKYVIKYLNFSNKAEDIINFLETVESTGGGDSPEAYELALRTANKNFDWSKGNSNKALVMIGDAVPHPPSYTDQSIFWGDELDELIKIGVKVYGVQVGDAEDAAAFYEELADRSGGVCIKLKHIALITDMFMAVCYKEYGTEHLETFRTEVETREGTLDPERENMFSQLKTDSSTATKKTKSFPFLWWSRANDTGRCYYCLDTNGKWTVFNHFRASTSSSTTTPFVPASKKKRASSAVKKTSKPKRKSESDSSGTSPTKTKKRRSSSSASTSSPSTYVAGQIVAIRGQDKKTWLGKIKGISGTNAEVNWFDELGSSPGTYALLKWEDTIPVNSIISLASVLEDRKRGVFVLQGALPV